MPRIRPRLLSARGWAHSYVDGTYVHENRHGYLDGTVATPHGFVRVFSIAAGSGAGENERPVTRFQFIWRARLYNRTYLGKLSRAGAIRVAGRVARSIAGAKR